MNEKYMCYCGLYCENCAVKATVEPSSRVLYEEMKRVGFEDIINLLPNGEGFWSFLKSTCHEGMCSSCKEGSGNPGCEVRICAKEKGLEMCAFCEEYPCHEFDEFFQGYPSLKRDNDVLRNEGLDKWAEMQDERKKKGLTHSDQDALI